MEEAEFNALDPWNSSVTVLYSQDTGTNWLIIISGMWKDGSEVSFISILGYFVNFNLAFFLAPL
jgi:hypothetical protein